jgi:hypothetical protein
MGLERVVLTAVGAVDPLVAIRATEGSGRERPADRLRAAHGRCERLAVGG